MKIVQVLPIGKVIMAVKIAITSLFVEDGKKKVEPLKVSLGLEGEVWTQPQILIL
jgi:hypothetical protein